MCASRGKFRIYNVHAYKTILLRWKFHLNDNRYSPHISRTFQPSINNTTIKFQKLSCWTSIKLQYKTRPRSLETSSIFFFHFFASDGFEQLEKFARQKRDTFSRVSVEVRTKDGERKRKKRNDFFINSIVFDYPSLDPFLIEFNYCKIFSKPNLNYPLVFALYFQPFIISASFNHLLVAIVNISQLLNL